VHHSSQEESINLSNITQAYSAQPYYLIFAEENSLNNYNAFLISEVVREFNSRTVPTCRDSAVELSKNSGGAGAPPYIYFVLYSAITFPFFPISINAARPEAKLILKYLSLSASVNSTVVFSELSEVRTYSVASGL